MDSSAPAILVRDLHKSYGAVEAVRGIDFEVAGGEVFGLLGPNGAGKTTTVEVLEGYRQRTSGIVSVLGHDPATRPRALRERVGIVLQSSGIYRHATPRELITHWAGFYPRPRDIEEVIDLAGLRQSEHVLSRRLSGGQARRLDFALALVGDPELIFLDEPTTGFDPAARRAAWDTIRALADLGKTVLLTTHYLDEAQALCDRVAIVKDGRILAVGAPAERGGGASSRYRVSWRDEHGEQQARETDDPTGLLHQLTSAALARGVGLDELSVSRPSLEDVYLELTAEARVEPEPVAAGPPSTRRGRR
jgi:ABC-2 type transport system ATP-binding protein